MVCFSFHLKVRLDISIDWIVYGSMVSMIFWQWQRIPLSAKLNTIKDPEEFIEIVPESENQTVTTNLNENFEHTLFGPFFYFLALFVIYLVIKLFLDGDRKLIGTLRVLEALRVNPQNGEVYDWTAFDSSVAKQLDRAYRSASLYLLALFSLTVGLISINGWTKCTIFAVLCIGLFSSQVLSVTLDLERIMMQIHDNLHALQPRSQEILPVILPEPEILHFHDDADDDDDDDEQDDIYDGFDEEVISLETSIPRIQYGADVVNETEINYDQAFYFRIFVTDFFN